MRGDGQLFHTIEIFHEYPKFAALIEEDTKNGRPWGVSLGKDLWMSPDQRDIISKDITHIGLTRNPLHGDAKHVRTHTPQTRVMLRKFPC